MTPEQATAKLIWIIASCIVVIVAMALGTAAVAVLPKKDRILAAILVIALVIVVAFTSTRF